MMNKIEMLRNLVDAYIIPSTDEWQNEYTSAKRLEWISGFSGSNGLLIITKKDLFLLTDSRYLLQAKSEVLENYKILDMYEKDSYSDLNIQEVIGYDPMLHTKKNIEYYEKLGLKLKPIDGNLIDILWRRDESKHNHNIFKLKESVTGKTSEQKLDDILNGLNAEYLLLTSPASICWLLNIRGNDIPHNPLILSYAIIEIKSKKVELFVHKEKILELKKLLPNVILTDIKFIKEKFLQIKGKIAIDKNTASIWFIQHANKILDLSDPTIRPRSIKNEAEINGVKEAHVYDGVAVCKFWYWLYDIISKGNFPTEKSASDMLYEYRKKNHYFYDSSFGTISGYGSNGAMIHYSFQNNIEINPNTHHPIYLLDSGGQYTCAGTTDITRVFDLSCNAKHIANDEHKRNFTLALKGHIALANAIFPKGTSGGQLDVLARKFLWQYGLNYGHGTGHGVGHFSFVHEGPHSISKNNNILFEVGMITSIEPGYYKENEYGIRIENLYLVQKSELYENFLCFELLTMVPIETSLVDWNLMNQEEKDWLKTHNTVVLNKIKKYLSDDEMKFIKIRSKVY